MTLNFFRALVSVYLMFNCACASTPTSDLSDRAVAFRYQRVDGQIDTLGRHRGKIVLVSVFATWAEPALLEVPLFKRLQNRFGPEQFIIIQIAIDQEQEAVEVYAETFEVEHLVGWPLNLARFTGEKGPLGPVNVLPSSILLDTEGKVIRHLEGTWDPKILEETLVSLLAADRSSH